jgi:hypothetical protein
VAHWPVADASADGQMSGSKQRINKRSDSRALSENNEETEDKKEEKHWYHPPEFPLPEKM